MGETIAEFYAGKTILVTGATGFLGGVVVEKLLRSCPDLKKIFVLIRKKKEQQDVHERLKNMFEQPLYAMVEKDALCKVEPLEGDVSQPGLQLSPEASEMLIRSVDVVFHVAACINFRAPLDRAIKTNLLGTATLLKLSKKMKNIKSFVYVSTAYCNTTERDVIAEEVYPNRFDPNTIIELAHKLKPEEIKEKTSEFLGGHPNTYSFTKRLAENYVQRERGSLPVAIIRPSIVLGTLNEPFPGWVDNVNSGAFAFIAGAGRGVFRTLFADETKIADIVPADLCSNLIIAAGWKISKSREIEIYHFSSGSDNPITWGEYCNYTIAAVHKYPCSYLVYYPQAKTRSCRIRNQLYFTLTHYFPAVILDFLLKTVGYKNILLESINKYQRGTDLSGFFTREEWIFEKGRTDALLEEIPENERKEFDFDVSRVHWENYMESCARGIRKFYHGESDKTLPSARMELASWKVIDTTLKSSFFIFIVWFGLWATGDITMALVIGIVLTFLFVWF